MPEAAVVDKIHLINEVVPSCPKPYPVPSPVFLITPPFTQLNTPYPATAYLKGFFNTKNIPAVQADLGIEVILSVFCKAGLTHLFKQVDSRQDLLPTWPGSLP